MKIYDISLPLGADTPVYAGDPPITVTPKSSIAGGDSANVSLLSFGSHSATHIDAPYHFNRLGETIDRLPPELFIGPAQVVETPAPSGLVSLEELAEKTARNTRRLLIKTTNSRLWALKKGEFVRDFVSLSPEGAAWIVEQGIGLVGVDYLSVERFRSPDHLVHRTLLDNKVAVLEGLDLSRVTPGRYLLCCLPLRIAGGDGAPARAVLIDDQNCSCDFDRP